MKLYLCLLCLVAVVSARYEGERKMHRLSVVTTNVAERLQLVIQLEEINTTASPFSIQFSLANLYLGTSGDTATEIATALELYRFTGGPWKPHEAFYNIFEEYKTLDKSEAQVCYGTFISVPPGHFLQPKFLNSTATYYPGTKVAFHNQTHPLATEQDINDYIKNKTCGYITDIVKPGSVGNQTGLVISDALHIVVVWAQPLLKVDTYIADFFINSTTKIQLPTMYDDYRMMNTKTDNVLRYSMAEMPTKTDRFSCYFVLPIKGNNVTNLEKSLAEGNNSNGLFENLKNGSVEFSLPKFRIESHYELSSDLKSFGIRKAFDPAQANFSAFSRSDGAYISKYYHKSVIEIGENGTAPVPGQPYVYHEGPIIATILLNRPFLYYCRDNKNGLVLLTGKFWGR